MRPFALLFLLLASAPAILSAAPGDLDTAFGTQGIALTTIQAAAEGIVLQPSGKILLLGALNGNAVVIRLHTNGSLDTEFGNGGIATIDFGGSNDYPVALEVSAAGDIVLAAYSNAVPGSGFAFARLTQDGAPVVQTITPQTGVAHSMALQSEGKVVMVGDQRLIVRYNSDGSLDNSFDSDGKRFLPSDIVTNVYDVSVQPDGKLVLTGDAFGDFITLRLLQDGSLDNSFSSDGWVTTPVGDAADYGKTVTIQPDNYILVAGYSAVSGGTDFSVVRFTPDGALDTSFNTTGKLLIGVKPVDTSPRLHIQTDGKILLAGNTGLLRLLPSGTLDSTFGTAGILDTLAQSDFGPAGLTVQSNGEILLAGSNGGVLAARYHSGIPADIVVEQPAGQFLSSNAPQPVDFGTVISGASASKTFTIRNRGSIQDLTGLAITKAAAGHPADFAVGALGSTLLSTDASTTFTVTFSPSGAGIRSATLEIASNDPDENPFIIQVTGRQATNLEAWRQTHFGTMEATGSAADLSDPDSDGIPNLMEFATGTPPNALNLPVGELVKNGNTLEFTYWRSKAAVGEVSFIREFSQTISGTWSQTGGTVETILEETADRQKVMVTTPAGSAGKRFVRLRVSRL